MRYGISIFILFAGFSYPVIAQQHIFQTYSSNDGLVANSVRRIFQDSQGFLWIGTLEGLSKYDGHKFTNYTTFNGISHNMINDIFESPGKKIYTAGNDGSIDLISPDQVIKKAVPNTVVINRFCKTGNGKFVATTDMNGLYEFKNDQLSKPSQANASSNYHDIAILDDSLFIAATDSSLQVLTRQYQIFAEDRDPSNPYYECKIYKDSKERVWVATLKGLKLLSAKQNKSQPLTFVPLPSSFDLPLFHKNKVTTIFEDNTGNMWFGTTHGLMKIGADGSSQLFNNKNGLLSEFITSLYQDREMNIWIGTSLGLVKLVTKNNILVYTTENGLLANKTNFIRLLENDNVLIQHENGLQVYDRSTGHVLPKISNENYYGSVKYSNPCLLFGQDKLSEFDMNNNRIIKTTPFDLSPGEIYCAVKDKQGNIIAGNEYGLFISSNTEPQKFSSINARIEDLLIDTKGYLWVATWDDGLYQVQYDHSNNKTVIISTEHFLKGKKIRTLYEDSKGSIWTGTRHEGAYRLTDQGSDKYSMEQFDQKKGLTSNWIKSITEDANGCIWIGFYQGLDKLIPHNKSFRVFNFSRVNNYFTGINNIVIDKKHELWLSTVNGIAHITDGQMENSPPLPVFITSVSITDSNYSFNTKKEFTHKENQVRFEFTSPGFINEKQVSYSYRLIGSSSTGWSLPVNQHVVSYANLQPGTYRFEVKMMGWNTEWGEPSFFAFTIRPPFWQTGWFITVCLLTVAALIYWAVRKRIAAVRHKAEIKNKISEIEMSALRAQMNPHFIFNCLNSIDNLIQTDQKEKATDYLAKFARLIRAILENSKTNTIPCWKDLETLKLYLQMEELRWDKKISCNIRIANEIQNGDYKVPPMIVQPFVENAIHHGLLNKMEPDKKLSVEVKLEGNEIKYTIVDNGVGRLQAAEYKKINRSSAASLGMQITKDRIDLFNQHANGSVKITDLYNDQQEPNGTMVEVWLTTQPFTT